MYHGDWLQDLSVCIIVLTEAIDPTFLEEHEASSFVLAVDWLETSEDNEKKVAYKRLDNGDVQILLISKIAKGSNRTSEKERINEEKYRELLDSSILHLKKRCYEFTYTQNDVPFSVKYDEFADGELCMLEVDALSEEERNSFSLRDFPSELIEVTGDVQYYGYRVAQKLKLPS